MNEQLVSQPSVSSPGVFHLMSVVNHPRLCRRRPVCPILPILTFKRLKSNTAGSRTLPIPIHGDIPSSRYAPDFLRFFSYPYAAIRCAPSHTVRPVINYNYRLISHKGVYILQRVTWGIKGYITKILVIYVNPETRRPWRRQITPQCWVLTRIRPE